MKTKIIDHRNLDVYLDRLRAEPSMQCKPNAPKPPKNAWWHKPCYLEFPLGELAHDGLTNLALLGTFSPVGAHVDTFPIDGTERFNAHGLEGKVRVRKSLFSALMNLRDILPENRGRIVLD